MQMMNHVIEIQMEFEVVRVIEPFLIDDDEACVFYDVKLVLRMFWISWMAELSVDELQVFCLKEIDIVTWAS